jgi:hypothetical protein
VDQIKALLFSTLDLLAQDYEAVLFSKYTAWTTSYGVELATIDDAFNFLQFHEGLHVGYVMALKRLVKQ